MPTPQQMRFSQSVCRLAMTVLLGSHSQPDPFQNALDTAALLLDLGLMQLF